MTRKALRWVTWSRRRLAVVAVTVLVVFGFAATVALTGVVLGFQGATTPEPTPTAPTHAPSDLATGDPIWGKTTSPSPTGSLPMPATATPDQVARQFAEVWLSARQRPDTKESHDAWVADAGAYGEAALRAQLAATRLDEVPAATVTSVHVEMLLQSANVTITLSTGGIVVVQMKDGGQGWRVHGMHSGAA